MKCISASTVLQVNGPVYRSVDKEKKQHVCETNMVKSVHEALHTLVCDEIHNEITLDFSHTNDSFTGVFLCQCIIKNK